MRYINGGPAKPTDKPPRPFEEGIGGHPTLVSNVETLANLPFVHHHGADAYRAQGTAASPGTFLATITGAGRPAALYELPHGVRIVDLLALHGVSADHVTGVLMGGYFAGLLNREVLDATLDHETIRGLGSGLGCGALAILTDDCPVAVAASVMAYFDRENAGQCGSCFNGTAAMSAVTEALRDGAATSDDLARLERWSVVLRGRGACATLDAATNVAASLLLQFPQVVARHLDGECDACRTDPWSAVRPYEVEIPFGVIREEAGRLIGIQEKPSTYHLINSGVYVLGCEAVDMVPKDTSFPITSLFEKLLERRAPVGVYALKGDWIDVGRHEELRRARGES